MVSNGFLQANPFRCIFCAPNLQDFTVVPEESPTPWQVFILDESLKPLPDSPEEVTGLLGVAGPQADQQ